METQRRMDGRRRAPRVGAMRVCAVMALLIALQAGEDAMTAAGLTDPVLLGRALADDGDGDGDGDGDDGGDGDSDGDGSGAGGSDSDSDSDDGDDSDDDDDGDDDDEDDDDDDDGDGDDDDDDGDDDVVVGEGAGAAADRGDPDADFAPDEVVGVNPSAAALGRAARLGFGLGEVVEAAALGLRVARLTVPPRLDVRTAVQILNETDPQVFALNSRYRLAEDASCQGPVCDAHDAIAWPANAASCGVGQRVGIIDTGADTAHPALRRAGIVVRRFDDRGAAPSVPNHGTAVAGLLVGDPESVHPGLIPAADLMVADPFFRSRSGDPLADTPDIVAALDWLVDNGTVVVGLPFVGGRNPALERAIAAARTRDAIPVAAAGNGGPGAPPAFPAAYEGVVAVTAVDVAGRAYRRANQGAYVDYAAPGVGIWTIDGARGRARSGTSFAVPFMVALLSQTLATDPRRVREAVRGGDPLPVVDLGPNGRDRVYGWGLPRFDGRCGR